ncbi:hypothetical protein AMTRI_Chr02g257630 [Amborella trichopoda]
MGLILPNVCLMCKVAEETIDHMFIHCPFVATLWDWLSLLSNWITPLPEGTCNLLQHLWRIVVGASLWNLCKERNLRTFEGRVRDYPPFLSLSRKPSSCGLLLLGLSFLSPKSSSSLISQSFCFLKRGLGA